VRPEARRREDEEEGRAHDEEEDRAGVAQSSTV
jgi:hypothetical protein